MKQFSLKTSVIALFVAVSFFATADSAQAASRYGAKGKDIGSFMEALHKGRTSAASLAKQGKLSSAQVNQLARNYRLMLTMAPPKNKTSWKASVGMLINATAKLARNPKDPKLIAAYSRAADCNACHRKHR